jgi:hypothetical protein
MPYWPLTQAVLRSRGHVTAAPYTVSSFPIASFLNKVAGGSYKTIAFDKKKQMNMALIARLILSGTEWNLNPL